MAFTTYKAFVNSLATMTITGVKTELDEPPQQLNDTDMPIQFPRLPTGSSSADTFGSAAALSEATCELAIVINPISLDLQDVNYALALTLLDNTEAALIANAASLGFDSWTLEVQRAELGNGTPYWAVVATVEASG